jgi:hypothetical protein
LDLEYSFNKSSITGFNITSCLFVCFFPKIVWQLLNNSQNGNATASGAGSGTVQNGSAIGEGTGVANVGFGMYSIHIIDMLINKE